MIGGGKNMPQNQKKVFKNLLILALLLLSGCNNGTDSSITNESSSEETPTSVDPKTLATVRGKVLTDAGEMIAAGIIVENAKGETYRTSTNFQSAYNLRLEPGTYKFHFTRGFEYSTVTKTLTVEAYKTYYVQDVRLIQLEDSYAKGWIRGDTHQHTYYSDGINSVPDVLASNISNGLHYGFLTDHNTAWGLPEWVQGNRLPAQIDAEGNSHMFGAYEGMEVTTEFGHYQSYGLGLVFDLYEVSLRDIERTKPQAEKDEIIKDRIRYIGDTIRWAGAVAQINHPYSTSTMGFRYWEDDVLSCFDTIEIWNGYFIPGDGRYEPEKEGYQGQNYRSKVKWFEILNNVKNGGPYLAAVAGTDNHDVSGSYIPNPDIDLSTIEDLEDYNELFLKHGKYTGSPSTVVKIDGKQTDAKVMKALKDGNSFLTNGPMIYANINGKTYGEVVSLTTNSATLNLELFARDGYEEVRIIKNGEVIKTFASNASERFTTNYTINNLENDDWLVLEVYGTGVQHAISNPIFISIA